MNTPKVINLPYLSYLQKSLSGSQLTEILDHSSHEEAYYLIRYLYLVTIQRALANSKFAEQTELLQALVKSDQDFYNWVESHPKTAAAMIEAGQRAIMTLRENSL